ncbi:haloalkane dehalogenase [Veronia nyctiphanis]|uniref:Haloalkane dehalogenase n=1 Tax=Veronia nyctiphanis TaxID=1278244 RepID=A0A4Q0YUF2_9GAMM|nr:haloalkane dehalogenase [Veronia nyctiphanis]RXJ72779.1 haloalkane dehalogenase [Veronia nyctiphanis]
MPTTAASGEKPETFWSYTKYGTLETVRTPDERFNNLSGYSFSPNYITVDGLRMHYVDEGPKDGEVILLLHGEPTWAYLYRKMIPALADRGYRVIAPDLIGFGRSDKLLNKSDHSYARHVVWMKEFVKAMKLKKITLFVQDWGSYIGLRVAAGLKGRFDRVLLSNGGLPTGENTPLGFYAFKFSVDLAGEHFPIAEIMQVGTVSILKKDELLAYLAPYPNTYYTAGPDVFDDLVPTSPDMAGATKNKEVWKIYENWHKPFLTVFGKLDLVLGTLFKEFKERVPGAQGQQHDIIPFASHFIQEDAPNDLVNHLDNFIKNN